MVDNYKVNEDIVNKLFDSLDMLRKNGIVSQEIYLYIDKYFKGVGIESISDKVFEFLSKQEDMPDWFKNKYKDYIKENKNG